MKTDEYLYVYAVYFNIFYHLLNVSSIRNVLDKKKF